LRIAFAGIIRCRWIFRFGLGERGPEGFEFGARRDEFRKEIEDTAGKSWRMEGRYVYDSFDEGFDSGRVGIRFQGFEDKVEIECLL
jgi:hypothetical protein